MKTNITILATILFNLICFQSQLHSQHLKSLKPEDFKLWYDLQINAFSPNGNWFEISKSYEHGKDTLEVHSIDNATVHKFSNIRTARLLDHHFIFIENKSVKILELNTGNTQIYNGFNSYDYLEDQHKLLLVSIEQPSVIKILSLREKGDNQITGVKDYKISPDNQKMILSREIKGKNEVWFYNISKDKLSKMPLNIIRKATLSNFIWSLDSNRIAFIQDLDGDEKGQRIISYNLKNKKETHFNTMEESTFPISQKINAPVTNKPFRFSKFGDRIFFCSIPKQNQKVKWDQTVEIWHTQDNIEHLNLSVRDDLLNYPIYHIWNVDSNIYEQLTTTKYPDVFFSGDQEIAFLYTNTPVKVNLKIEPDIDLEIIDLDYKKTIKLIEGLEYKTSNIDVSSKGNYFHYFQDLQWMIVDLKTGAEFNLSELFGFSLYDTEHSWSGSPPAYGIAGYDPDEDHVFVYDAYDIWELNIKTFEKRRLTKGREQKRKFRIAKVSNEFQDRDSNWSHTTPVVDLDQPLLFELRDSLYYSGFFLLDNNKLREVVYSSSYKYAPRINGNQLIYLEENQNLPPRIMYWNKQLNESKVIFQSNPQHFKYQWGDAELLSHEDSTGKEQTFGALFYPFDYDLSNTYPMVVSIYESPAYKINRYSRPSFQNTDGFNISLLRSQGYFVLLPNLRYKLNNVGVSANSSLNKMLDETVKNQAIDQKRIGLTGYSFGGYETNYVVSHNNRFAAAISGGGFNDLIRRYTTLNSGGGPQFFQFENYQTRMTGPYFQFKEAYLKNSPILDVQNISTPLLIYSGKEDYHVNWSESVALYLGLKRAGKKAVLLLYPNEGHVFSNPKHNEDVTKRTMDWFGHFLKGDPKLNWMTSNSYDLE